MSVSTHRSCGEELGYTFLSCVLSNLHRAPLISDDRGDRGGGGGGGALWAEDVDAVVAPASACGGPAVLSLVGKRDDRSSSSNSRRTILVVSQS